jgi:hypothetical protein
MTAIYILLTIIAIGVFLISDVGRGILKYFISLFCILCILGGLLVLGFYVVTFLKDCFTTPSIKARILDAAEITLGYIVGGLILVAVVFSLLWLIKYTRGEKSRRKERQRLLTESKQVSPDGKIYCIFCKKFTDTETDKNSPFCNICGRQRGLME